MNNYKNIKEIFGLIIDYAIYQGHLTTNILGGSSPTMGPWGQLSPPPTEECFRSKTDKLKPVCSKLVRNQNSCVICKESWKLHEKKLASMARNRELAAKSRIKRLKASQDLRNEFQYLTTLARTSAETLAEVNRINASIVEKIKKTEEEREILKLVRYLHNTD